MPFPTFALANVNVGVPESVTVSDPWMVARVGDAGTDTFAVAAVVPS